MVFPFVVGRYPEGETHRATRGVRGDDGRVLPPIRPGKSWPQRDIATGIASPGPLVVVVLSCHSNRIRQVRRRLDLDVAVVLRLSPRTLPILRCCLGYTPIPIRSWSISRWPMFGQAGVPDFQWSVLPLEAAILSGNQAVSTQIYISRIYTCETKFNLYLYT
jgi:hypothetical protein